MLQTVEAEQILVSSPTITIRRQRALTATILGCESTASFGQALHHDSLFLLTSCQ
jgi:hypothetical protein